MTQALPECLNRSAADDRAEALRSLTDANGRHLHPEMTGRKALDAALAAIQRREAEAVHTATHRLHGNGTAACLLAVQAAQNAWAACRPVGGYAQWTLPQRATLLDAARALVRLAIEVSP